MSASRATLPGRMIITSSFVIENKMHMGVAISTQLVTSISFIESNSQRLNNAVENKHRKNTINTLKNQL